MTSLMTTNALPDKQRMTRRSRSFRFNKNLTNLLLDSVILLAFVVEMQVPFTGIRTHEVLGLVFASILLVHIVLHWNWIWSVTVRFFRNLFHESRLNYVLAVVLLVDMVVVTITGIAISHTLGWNLNFGLSGPYAHRLHSSASYLSLILVGLHIALQWQWIVTNTRKYFFGFLSHRRSAKPTISQ